VKFNVAMVLDWLVGALAALANELMVDIELEI
jgi:hypothetical protein